MKTVRIAVSAVSLLSATTLLARNLDEIRKSGEIRICFSHSPGIVWAEPPTCTTSCKWRGPGYDITMAYVESLGKGIKAVTRNVDWDSQFADDKGKVRQGDTYTPKFFQDGTCDLYPSNLTRNAWREKLMDFAVLFPSRMVILARKDDAASFTGPKSLAGKTAFTKKETSFDGWLLESNKSQFQSNPIKIEYVDSNVDEFARVAKAKGAFTIADADAAFNVTNKVHKDLARVMMVGELDELGWAVRKGDADLLASINAFLSTQKADPKSRLNQIWISSYGLDLGSFEQMVRAMK